MTREDATSIKELIMKIAADCISVCGIVEGKIDTADPLKVTLTNDAKINLTASEVIVPEYLKERKKTITYIEIVDDEEVERELEITIKDGLKSGDKVYMLQYNAGKQYFILSRIEEGDE